MTGEVKTTSSGLSEAILWDYVDQRPAALVLDYYGIDQDAAGLTGLPCRELRQAAEVGLRPGTKLSRAESAQ